MNVEVEVREKNVLKIFTTNIQTVPYYLKKQICNLKESGQTTKHRTKPQRKEPASPERRLLTLYISISKLTLKCNLWGMVWLGSVLWHINYCLLFNVKSCFNLYIRYMICYHIL